MSGFVPQREVARRIDVLRRWAFIFAATVLILPPSCAPPQSKIPVVPISSTLEPLKTDFNRDVGKVRLLLLLDPT